MYKHSTHGAFAKATDRARAAQLLVVAIKGKGWFVQSQDKRNSYLVWFDESAGEWRCPCHATVTCIHIGAAYLSTLPARAKAVTHATLMSQIATNAPGATPAPQEAIMLRHDNQGQRLFR